MIIALSVVAAILYAFSVFLEAVSAIARPAGAISGRNSMGYTTTVLINTCKRVFMVLYPPIIGVVAALGGADAVVYTIYLCFLSSLIPVYLASKYREELLLSLVQFVIVFSRGRGLIAAVSTCTRERKYLRSVANLMIEGYRKDNPRRSILERVDTKILLLASWVLAFYSIAVFSINIAGAYLPFYGAVIYQLVGVVNAIGTLVWAFILDPMLSRRFDSLSDVLGVRDSVLLANGVANLLMAPFLIFILDQGIRTVIYYGH